MVQVITFHRTECFERVFIYMCTHYKGGPIKSKPLLIVIKSHWKPINKTTFWIIMNVQEAQGCYQLVLYILICDVLICCDSSFAMIDHIIIKTWKGEEMDTKVILHDFPSKRLFTNTIHSLIKQNDARGRAYIICIIIWLVSQKHGSWTIIDV